MRYSRWWLFVLIQCCMLPTAASAQERPETIRGRVISDSGAPIATATVSATMAPDRSYRQATTDSAGRYVIHFPAGTGDYLIHASALGFKAFRKRLTRAPADTALTLDVVLTRDVARLEEVRVEAKKARPDREQDAGRDVGAAQREREGILAAVPPDQDGSFAAVANAIPGAMARPDGLSVLGLPGDQSNATLNGMAFGGAGLPRDARTQVRVGTSTYDPSRGGFSGGQTSVELQAGSPFIIRSAHTLFDAPALQAPSRIGDRLGQRFAAFNASIGGSGELVPDKWYYNAAVQAVRRQANVASLLSAGDDALTAVGVAPDSVIRLQQILSAAGVPFSTADLPATAVTQTASFAARLDHTPYLPGGYDPSPESWSVTVFGNAEDATAQSFTPTAFPTTGARRTDLFLGGQAVYSRFLGDVLNETRTAMSANRRRGTPYLGLPTGRVLVSSVLPTADAALTDLTFGGNGAAGNDRRSWTWETINETQFFTNRSHRLKLTAESRLDGYSDAAPANTLGTFTYPSLSALAANQPSSFARTLASPIRRSGEWSGFVALGDYWRLSPGLQLIYGARLDGNRYTTTLSDNPAVARAFGAATAFTPNRVHMSPRLGFAWSFGKRSGGDGIRFTDFARQSFRSGMMLRGGVGEFRNLLPVSLVANAANGLPGGPAQLVCIGDAVPAAQWSSYLTDGSTVPTSCASGAPSSFVDAAPAVRLFDRSYDAPRSWRANLSWQGTLPRFAVAVEGVYSLNLNQPGTFDLNFTEAPRFTLADEGNRPVFVTPASIVPATGVVSPVEARMNGAFGRVVSSRSDLASTSRQLIVTITPEPFNRMFYSLAYTLADAHAESRGFDGAGFGSPTIVERTAAALDVRHQVQASFGLRLPHNTYVALFGRFMSGLPYTPLVAGDVNGDGLANDRAFVFDPAQRAGTPLGTAMQSLLATAPGQARACLLEQLGRPAARHSCRGPWTAYMNAQIGLYNRFGFTRRRFNATLNVTNPLGGLDQLLHGADHLHGWGGAALPDPMLLTVRGFDPTTRQFSYEVNPRFGSTQSARQLARVPFRMSLDLRFDLGVPVAKQQAQKLLRPGRAGRAGTRLSADSMAAMLKRQVPDLYALILRESDSLLISREQGEVLKTRRVPYQARIDSLWKATTTTLAAMGDDYDADKAMYLIDEATERAWIIDRDELPTLARILSPLQMRMAPLLPGLQQTVGKKTVGFRTYMF